MGERQKMETDAPLRYRMETKDGGEELNLLVREVGKKNLLCSRGALHDTGENPDSELLLLPVACNKERPLPDPVAARGRPMRRHDKPTRHRGQLKSACWKKREEEKKKKTMEGNVLQGVANGRGQRLEG